MGYKKKKKKIQEESHTKDLQSIQIDKYKMFKSWSRISKLTNAGSPCKQFFISQVLKPSLYIYKKILDQQQY